VGCPSGFPRIYDNRKLLNHDVDAWHNGYPVDT
jgi:hypothetical protein